MADEDDKHPFPQEWQTKRSCTNNLRRDDDKLSRQNVEAVLRVLHDVIVVADENPRYKNVVRDGRVLGQLQPMVANGNYRMFALCFCSKHKERCSRSRGWNHNAVGETPDHVHRVLAHWVIRGHDDADCKSTSLHMGLSRF